MGRAGSVNRNTNIYRKIKNNIKLFTCRGTTHQTRESEMNCNKSYSSLYIYSYMSYVTSSSSGG